MTPSKASSFLDGLLSQMSTNQRLSLIVKAAVGVICLITLVWSAFDTSLLDSFEEASKNSADESWQVHGAIAAAERRLSEERARQERGPDNGEQSVSDMLCSPMRPNPHKIAVCIAGNSRTLRYPLVYKTMKHNVMDAIGGDVTVFAALKLADAPVDHSHDLWPQPMANSYELIEPALDYLNVSKTVIVRSDEIFKINKNCRFRPGTWLSNEGPLRRMIGQYSGIKECYDLVLEHERENGMQFDMILRMRPDAAWMSSIPPWCVYNRNVVYAPFTTDHFNLMDRRHADIVFNLITWYYNCNEERTEHDPEDLLKALVYERTGHGLKIFAFNLQLVREVSADIALNLCPVLGGRMDNLTACNMMFNTHQDRE